MFNWLLLLIAYIPFQIALNPWPGVDLASGRVFILLLFGVWLITAFFRKQLNVSLNFQAVILLIFLFMSGFSILMSGNYLWGLRKFLFFLSIFPLYFLAAYLADSYEKIKKIIWTLVISAGTAALIGLVQFSAQFVFGLERIYGFWAFNIVPVFSGFNLGALILAYPSWLVNVSGKTIMRAISIFSDPHVFSLCIGLILPLAVVLLYGFLKKNQGKFLIFNFQFLIIFISYFILYISSLLSFSRGAYLALTAAFLVLAWLFWKHLNSKKITLLLLFSLLILIIPKTPISARFYSAFNLAEGSNAGRLEMWQEASYLGLENPWWGLGLGNYSLAIDPSLGYRNPMTAHNLYLDLFSEMGIFALLVWLVLILGTIWGLFNIARSAANIDASHRGTAVGLIGSLVYFSVHSFFETAIYSPIIFAVLMVILGLCSKILSRSETI